MKKRLWSFSLVASLVLGLATLGSASLLQAQSQDQQQSQPPTADQPQSQPDSTPSQPPADDKAQAQPSSEGQSFTGTILKSGNKWMFQDAATGNTYDIDHQDEVKKFEGKRVKVHGTLDQDKKMIHVQ